MSYRFEREYLTYCETAVLLGLKSESAVKRLIKQGLLKRHHLGHRTVRIRRTEALEFLRANGGVQDGLF